MKVVHIVKTLALEYGGPARSVQGLVANLQSSGVETYLIVLEGEAGPWVKGIKNFRCLKTRGLYDTYCKVCRAIDDIRPDIIHTHDCWMPKLHICHMVARARHIPYVISPRGALKRWSRNHKRLKKWIALKTYEGYDLKHAAALHVTAQDEYEQVGELGLGKHIFLATNGVNLPEICGEWGGREKFAANVKRKALFLSRIHYTKGLMNLVEAWNQVRPAGWVMEIVGTDADGYQKEVAKRVVELGLSEDFIFFGPVSDRDKWQKYTSADLFVHPSFTENFGIVIAEALYSGLPVIATKGAPWQDLVDNRCGWWVDIGARPLAVALSEATRMSDEELRIMGESGRKLVEAKYTWDSVVKKMVQEYETILKYEDK